MENNANNGKKQDILNAKYRAFKDAKMLPNLVFKIETFERDVVKLSK